MGTGEEPRGYCSGFDQLVCRPYFLLLSGGNCHFISWIARKINVRRSLVIYTQSGARPTGTRPRVPDGTWTAKGRRGKKTRLDHNPILHRPRYRYRDHVPLPRHNAKVERGRLVRLILARKILARRDWPTKITGEKRDTCVHFSWFFFLFFFYVDFSATLRLSRRILIKNEKEKSARSKDASLLKI